MEKEMICDMCKKDSETVFLVDYPMKNKQVCPACYTKLFPGKA